MLTTNASSPWHSISAESKEYSQDGLCGELLLASRASEWKTVGFEDATALSALLKSAFELQFVQLFDSLLQGRFCFGQRNANIYDALSRIVQVAASFAEFSFPTVTPNQDEVRIVFEWWKLRQFSTDLAAKLFDRDYETWLANSIIAEFERRK